MYTLILGFILTQIFGIYKNIENSKKDKNQNQFHKKYYKRIFYSTFEQETNWFFRMIWYNFLLFFSTVAFIILIMSPMVEHSYKTVKTQEYLENLSDNSTISGHFFLGSGNVNNVWKYSYYTKKGNAFYLKNIDADGTPIIIIQDYSKPRIERTYKKDIGYYNWVFRDNDKLINLEIFVPKSSIQSNFNLDANG